MTAGIAVICCWRVVQLSRIVWTTVSTSDCSTPTKIVAFVSRRKPPTVLMRVARKPRLESCESNPFASSDCTTATTSFTTLTPVVRRSLARFLQITNRRAPARQNNASALARCAPECGSPPALSNETPAPRLQTGSTLLAANACAPGRLRQAGLAESSYRAADRRWRRISPKLAPAYQGPGRRPGRPASNRQNDRTRQLRHGPGRAESRCRPAALLTSTSATLQTGPQRTVHLGE